MRKWTKQPPAGTKIDTRKWPGVIAAWLFDTNGVLKDLSGNGYDAVPGTSSGATFTPGAGPSPVVNKFGRARDFDGATQCFEISSALPSTDRLQKPCSFLWAGIWDDTGDSSQRIIDKSNSGNASNGFAISINPTNNRFEIYRDGALTSNYFNGTCNPIANGNPAVFCATTPKDGVTGKGKVWVNGQSITGEVADEDFTGFSTTSTSIRIGTWNHSTGREYQGRMNLLVLFDYEIDPHTAKELSMNPWQIFEPPLSFALADPLPQTRSLTVPQVWTSPPPIGAEIDWSHPLAQGLAVLTRWITPDRFIDDVYGDIYSMSASGIDVDEGIFRTSHPLYGRGGGILSPSGVFAGGRKDDTFKTRNRFTSTSATIASIFTDVDTVSGSKTSFGFVDAGGGDLAYVAQPPFNLIVGISTAFSGVANSQAVTGGSSVVGDLKCVAGIFIDQGAIGDLRLYCRNLSNGTVDSATDFEEAKFVPATLNSDLTSIYMDQGENTSTYVGAYWNRALTDEELTAWSENPWQIYKRDPMHVPIEYEELTFDDDREERLFMIPQRARRQP